VKIKPTNVCPKCNNHYFRHSGKKINVPIDKTEKRNNYKIRKVKTVWTREGYYCKKCGWSRNGG